MDSKFEKYSKAKRRNSRNEFIDRLVQNAKKKQIIGRFFRLFQDGIKITTKRIALISKELVCLWQKLNFATISKQQVSAKIFRLVNDYRPVYQLSQENGKIKKKTTGKCF